MYDGPFDVDALRAAVSALLDSPCGTLVAVGLSHSSSRTYLTIAGDRAIAVKVNTDRRVLDGNAHNLRVLAGMGVPVPRVVAYDPSFVRAPTALLVMTAVPGRDLLYELAGMTREQMSRLAGQIVDIQQRVAALPVPGRCGYVPIGAPGTREWIDIVRRPSAHALVDPLPSDVAPLAPRMFAAISAASAYLASVTPRCFLDDLTTKNVMVVDGALTNVVDLDVVCYGDPLFHLGLTAASVAANLPSHCRYYVDELIR